jgi:hypothetical protein
MLRPSFGSLSLSMRINTMRIPENQQSKTGRVPMWSSLLPPKYYVLKNQCPLFLVRKLLKEALCHGFSGMHMSGGLSYPETTLGITSGHPSIASKIHRKWDTFWMAHPQDWQAAGSILERPFLSNSTSPSTEPQNEIPSPPLEFESVDLDPEATSSSNVAQNDSLCPLPSSVSQVLLSAL